MRVFTVYLVDLGGGADYRLVVHAVGDAEEERGVAEDLLGMGLVGWLEEGG